MAIAIVFDFPGVTQAIYDEASARLSGGKGLQALADWPAPGILLHVAGPIANGFRVIDVWESEAAFQAFGAKLAPIAKEVGFPDAVPQIMPVHKLVKA
jgi:hypothetical protein